ncbi:MAG: hypothetical protein HGB14_06125 [Anaerolineaceae bacterium]|nr:hypothetical protein [Anaerolineaceae bacterium]
MEESRLHQRINRLVGEIAMSIKWKRACISIAIYRSETIQDLVLGEVQQALKSEKKEMVNIAVDKTTVDIPVILRDFPNAENKIFSISGLRWGGGRDHHNAYRALNMHREYLVENGLVSIFWLTTSEIKSLAQIAPDFWAFRHQVIEFLDLPKLPLTDRSDDESVDSETLLSSYLSRLEIEPTNVSNLMGIANLYFLWGCYQDAIVYYRKVLRMAPDQESVVCSLLDAYKAINRSIPVRIHRLVKNH